jgi:serine protease
MHRPFIILGLGAVLIAAFSTRAAGQRESFLVVRSAAVRSPAYVPGEIVVAFATATSQAAVEHAVRDVGGVQARKSDFGGHYLVRLEDGVEEDAAVSRLRGMREVAWAERNGTARTTFVPNDQYFRDQWHMRLVGAERTWDIQRGDPSVVVAVVDTGIAYEDFGAFRKAPDWGTTQFVTGFNVFTRTEHANDDNFHGTHVASTIAEGTNNGIGTTGLCFDCALMPVKVLNASGTGSFFAVAEGIDYATNFMLNGRRAVKVINLSLGGDVSSTPVTQAIDRAVAAGIVVVASSGNEDGPVGFPAALPNVIAVGAVDARKRRAPYSNFGAELDVVAPGGDLDRDDDADGYPDGVLQQSFSPGAARLGNFAVFNYFFVQGTSQASPHVSAMAALLIRQGITEPAAVRKVIEQTAEDLGSTGRDNEFGYGLIRPAKALEGLGINR